MPERTPTPSAVGTRTSPGGGTPLLLPLQEIDAMGDGAIAAVGGKAANLGRLILAGFPVPPGFCVTTEAYRLAAGDTLRPVLDRLATTPATDTDALARLARHARDLLMAAPLPPQVAAAVTTAYLALGDGTPVAVRSSATAEDLATASFAGQQDTYLNVVGTDDVLSAVHRCWASLWTDRAVTYRAVNGIDHGSVRLAVVVQTLVDAAVAGVMFTVNPVTGSREQTVLDASPGLGESVVSGMVNPDRFVAESLTGRIVERRLGDKRVTVRASADGGTTHETRDEAAREYCLTDGQVRDLVALGRRVSALYGSPQDTEWALDADGALWLTQARPVTTLFPIPVREPNREPESRSGADPGPGHDTGLRARDDAAGRDLQVFFCFSVAQGVNGPLTPMGMATLRVVGSSAATTLGFPVADVLAGPPAEYESVGRLFLDITTLMRSSLGRTVAPKVLDVMEARSAEILRSLFDDPRLSVVHTSPMPWIRRILSLVVRYRVPLQVGRALVRPSSVTRLATQIEDEVRRATTVEDGAGSPTRLELVITAAGRVAPLFPRVMPVVGVGFALLGLAGKLLGPLAEPGDLQGVLRSLPNNVTTEMDLQLWHLATAVKADPASAAALRDTPASQLVTAYRSGTLPPVLQQELARFLDRYGHRSVAEIDIGTPRWADDPTYILGVLANYLRLDDGRPTPHDVFTRGAEQAEALVTSLTARAARRGRMRGRVVGFSLRRAREFVGLRELPKYLMVLTLSRLRVQLTAVGADLVGPGRLAAADDIYFLDLREAWEALNGRDFRDVVRTRRAEHAQEQRRRHVPRVLLSDGTEPEADSVAPERTDGALAGTPASAGRVTGTVRVIRDPVGAHLEPGEILVAPSTDPGWTPLFLTAGALVMEMGGANSHGAVVAREYGIPAVVGVAGATTRLVTGQRITVDGAKGLVTPQP
jgi:pyruvate,water dikinase